MAHALRNILLFMVATGTASPAAAQRIALKTVPIATGDQFFFVPTRTVGLGGLSVSVRDTLADPWSNPATGSRLDGLTVFAAPTGYSISGDIGSGITLAAGGMGRAGDWFGGITLAVQQLENPNASPFFFEFDRREGFIEDALPNDYVQLIGGRRIGERVAVGVSFFHAGLSAVEGVSQLYAGSAGIVQDGDLTDWRLGVTYDLPGGGTLEAVGLHSRLDMAHEVGTWEWFRAEPGGPVPAPRMLI